MKTTKSNTTKTLSLVTAVALTLGISAPPQAAASEAGAAASARGILNSLVHDFGLGVRDLYLKGFLREGQSQIIETTLHKGNDYYFVAGGCEDAFDVDIAVYDESGNLISRDNNRSRVGVACVTPRWTGKFYIKITMYDSTWDGAHWVLQTAFTN